MPLADNHDKLQIAPSSKAHGKALHTMMRYMVATKNRGLVLSPDTLWDGSKKFKFKIHVRSDSTVSGNKDDRRGISGDHMFVNNTPVSSRSNTQKTVTLSVTGVEGAAGFMVANGMLYVYCLLQSLGLEMELPMILAIENKGVVDLANNWSVGGRTRHFDVRNSFRQELNDITSAA